MRLLIFLCSAICICVLCVITDELLHVSVFVCNIDGDTYGLQKTNIQTHAKKWNDVDERPVKKKRSESVAIRGVDAHVNMGSHD